MKTRLLLAVIFITFIALGLPDALLGAAWNQTRLDLNQPIGSLGVITVVMYLMTITSTFLGPALIHRFETKTITLVSVLLTGSALVGMSQVTSFLPLVLLAVPLGLGAGAIDMSLNHYVAVHLNASHMSYLHAFYGVGVASGPFVMAVALSLYTWRTGMIIVGAGLILIALLIGLSFPLWKYKTTPMDEAPDIKTFNALNARGVKWSIMIFTVAVHAESFMGLFVATYAYVGLGFGLAESALSTFIFYGGLTAGRVLSGLVASKVNANHLIIAGELLMVVSAIGTSLFASSMIISMILFFFIGMGSGPVYPNMMHMNTVNFKPSQVSRIISLQMVIGYVGFGLITPLMGTLIDRVSMQLFPVILIIATTLLLLLTVGFVKTHPQYGRSQT